MCLQTKEIIQEKMDARDSSYSLRELTLEHFKTESSLEEIKNITLSESCLYAEYDIIAHEILLHIVEKFQEEGLEVVHEMHERGVIFPKQLKRILEDV